MPIAVYKPMGWTPLQAIQAFRTDSPKHRNERIGYAGRLDPMAEGVLVLLLGSENTERRDLLSLDKTYRVRVLFGVATDSYDALGLITQYCPERTFSDAQMDRAVANLVGDFSQELPPFSAAHYRGRPLYYWARTLGAERAPRLAKLRTVRRATVLSRSVRDGRSLLGEVKARIALIHGNFRQEHVLESWHEALRDHEDDRFAEVIVEIHCSTGTFMRSLAHDLGRAMGSAAIALEIIRTAVGEFTAGSAMRLC